MKLTFFTLLLLSFPGLLSANTGVISQCFSPQGNGGNYAASLGWMAETLQTRVRDARQQSEITGETIVFDFSCMTGGSSGSQASMIFMALVGNEKILKSPGVLVLKSIEDAQILADALRFMSLTADIGGLESLNFYRQVVSQTIEGYILSPFSKVKALRNFARNVLGNETPVWWDGQNVEGDQMLIDFLVTVLLADSMDLGLLYSGDFNGSPAVKFARFADSDSIPSEGSEFDRLEKEYAEKSKFLNEKASQFVSSQFSLGSFKSRYYFGAYNAAAPIRKIAEAALQPGFCTVTVGKFYDTFDLVPLDQAPNYKELKVIYMCSRATLESLLQTPAFLEDMQSNPYAEKIVLVEVKNIRGALAMSLREPLLMTEFADRVGSQKVEFLSYYSPAIHGEAKLYPFRDEAVAIAGGWPDRRISAWIGSYIALNRAQELRQQGYLVAGFHSMFGKPDVRSKDKFDTSSIRNIFSANPKDAEENISHWFAFQDNYCETFEVRFESAGIKSETVAFNWDISSLPAAQSGRSRFLTALSANATNFQIGSSYSSFAFDSYNDKGFISDFGAIPCTYE